MVKEAAAVRERIITVEYLEPTMSSHLLLKFPDNSAYDFDYSQSGIWSPLLPRGSAATATVAAASDSARKKPFRREERDKAKGKKLSKLKGKIRKKLAKKGLGLFTGSSSSPSPSHSQEDTIYLNFGSMVQSLGFQAWGKVLKAATRCFTRERRRASILSSADVAGFIELS
ncbi:unnamed protein product [Spirodela intermedia]|uniref:Uncharacterized protein n=1 Tax=Spirodela intermedia TaxID=51605 RepID=A0A7I8JFE2_SPIIN|nr:unnamed protein product [Spirodela intermedia]CAA6668651.1 unnamed protein product [Spirodela intermedia]